MSFGSRADHLARDLLDFTGWHWVHSGPATKSRRDWANIVGSDLFPRFQTEFFTLLEVTPDGLEQTGQWAGSLGSLNSLQRIRILQLDDAAIVETVVDNQTKKTVIDRQIESHLTRDGRTFEQIPPPPQGLVNTKHDPISGYPYSGIVDGAFTGTDVLEHWISTDAVNWTTAGFVIAQRGDLGTDLVVVGEARLANAGTTQSISGRPRVTRGEARRGPHGAGPSDYGEPQLDGAVEGRSLTMTQAMFEVERLLVAEFPWLRFGRHNCRPIGGGAWTPESTPSQHAFDSLRDSNGVGNARDLHGPAGLPLEQQQTLLDTVFEYLMSINDPMTRSQSGGSWNSATVSEGIGLKRMIWRQPAHFDHIHIDPWPTGHGHPSCSPFGPDVDEYRYSDSRVEATFNPAMEGSLPKGDGMKTEEWVTQLREEDIDRLWALGVHSGDPQHWKDKLDTPSDPEWDSFHTKTQVRLPIWITLPPA